MPDGIDDESLRVESLWDTLGVVWGVWSRDDDCKYVWKGRAGWGATAVESEAVLSWS